MKINMSAKELIQFLLNSKEANKFATSVQRRWGSIYPEVLDQEWENPALHELVGTVLQMQDEASEFASTRPGDDEASMQWEHVYHFVDHNVYLLVSGWDGSNGEHDVEEEYTVVRPEEVTITIYKVV